MTHILITDLREIRYMAYVPEEPKYKVNCGGTHACTCASLAFENGANRDVVDEYDDNCPHRYKADLEKAKRDSIEFDRVEDQEELKTHIQYQKSDPNYPIKPGIYQVPVEKPEIVSVTDCKMQYRFPPAVCGSVNNCDCPVKQVARIVQPKEDPQGSIWREVDYVLDKNIPNTEKHKILSEKFTITRNEKKENSI